MITSTTRHPVSSSTRAVISAALTLAVLLPVAATAAGKSGSAVRVTTGTVERAERTRLDSNVGKGALIGGTVGLLTASGQSGSKKARNAILGAGAGAVIAGATEGSREGMTYTVRTGSNESIRIVSDQTGIMVGDCVVVEEAGTTNNIRRVARETCDAASKPVLAQLQPQFQNDAAECAAAKDQLVSAVTAEAVDLAVRKVKILCND
jgi:hypothetical protein